MVICSKLCYCFITNIYIYIPIPAHTNSYCCYQTTWLSWGCHIAGGSEKNVTRKVEPPKIVHLMVYPLVRLSQWFAENWRAGWKWTIGPTTLRIFQRKHDEGGTCTSFWDKCAFEDWLMSNGSSWIPFWFGAFVRFPWNINQNCEVFADDTAWICQKCWIMDFEGVWSPR